MKLHSLLCDPRAVLVLTLPVREPAGWEDFRRAGQQIIQAVQLQIQGERVVLKPNVTSGERFVDPETGITTHPGFVQGMIEALRERGAPARRVTIAEDPRDTDDNEPRHWRGTGYETLGVRLYCPTTYTCVKKPVPNPQVFQRLNVSRLAVAPGSVLINVPKLKTHNLAITTLGMKNLMGLVNVFDRHYCLQAWDELPVEVQNNRQPRRQWFTEEMHQQWQMGLARRLVDTVQVIRPALTVVEGVVGREGTGFQRGRNRALGLVVAGINVVAVDSLASYLMGFDPDAILYLRLAAEAGLGETSVSALKVYTMEAGELTPCSDPAALRVEPPFEVIRNIAGETERVQRMPNIRGDASESFFGKSEA